jgi:hypothetical protein
MKEYIWRPKGLKINDSAVIGSPIVAFEKFVLPGISNPNWIENSKPVSDTEMSMREWAGLVIHSLSLSDKTHRDLSVGKDYVGGDGLLAITENGKTYGVYVEQTLVTYKAHTDLMTGIEERLMSKTSKGDSYTANKHLIIWCNIDGQFVPTSLASLIAKGGFNIVNIIGFNSGTREFSSYLYDKDIIHSPIHAWKINESTLIDSIDKAEPLRPSY